MDNPSVQKPIDRGPDDAECFRILDTRTDIFSIEGNGSPITIGVLALFMGISLGVWFRIVPSPFARSPGMFFGHEGAYASGQTSEDMDSDKKLSLREVSPEFFLKAKNTPAPQPARARIPAPSLGKNNPARNPAKPVGAARASRAVAAAPSVRRIVTAGESHAAQAPIAQVPESDSVWLHRGDQLKKHSDYSAAFDAYKRALAQNPRDGKALAGIGDLYRYSGLLDSSIHFYRAALTVSPKDASVHTGLGTALYENSQRAANPHFAKSRNVQDPARYVKEQYDSAIAEYTQAIALDSSRVDALTNRGVLRDLSNDHDAAIKDYTLAIKLQPGNADAYSKRAATYKDQGKLEAAIEDYTASIKLDSASYEFDPTLHVANAYLGRGDTYFKMRKFDLALADFNTTLALSPRHSLALISKGAALAEEKQYDSAIAAYTKAIALLSPKEYDGARMLAFLQMGNSWKALGKYDTAILDYQSAMESPNLASKACWRIAECFCFKNDAASALDWLRKAKSFRFAETQKWDRDRELSLLRNMPEFSALVVR